MRAAHYPIAIALALSFACSKPAPEAGDECRVVEDCAATERLACSQDVCVRLSCSRSAECPAGAACASGVCGLAECATDDDCRSFETCYEGDCRSDVCTFKSECERGEVCIGEPPTCRLPPANCESDRECPNDTYCKFPEQTCEARCTSDDSCTEDSWCDGEFCRLRCTLNTDCAGGEVCVDGRCEESTCQPVDCPASTPFLDPASCECVGCVSDADCGGDAGLGCSLAGTCLFCAARASAPSECAALGLVLVDGCCTECGQAQDCLDHEVCESGRCVVEDIRECQGDSDCPDGQRCDLGACVDPGSQTPCDVQSDCASGEACYGDGRCRAASDVCGQCPEPSRCVAEPGDSVGTCAGCLTHCSAEGCGDGVCYIPAGSTEGFCAAVETVSCP